MQAFVFEEYGPPDGLHLEELPRPVPKAGEILIRVLAASINDWDWGILQGKPFLNRLFYGLRKPRVRILGADVAGRVESAGEGAHRFRQGDAVYGDLSESGFGAFGEFVCASERLVSPIPEDMSFEQAAAIPQAASLAVQAIRTAGGLRAGQRILINGAGGGVGTFALQLAKLEDVEVTAVDRREKLERLRSLGADRVIDYEEHDFTDQGDRYDLILDVKSNRPMSHYLRALARQGNYVTVGGSMWRIFQVLLWGAWSSWLHRRRLHVLFLRPNQDLEFFGRLFEAGQIEPVLDGPYDFHELPRAMRRFAAAEHFGKIVLSLKSQVARKQTA